MKTAEETLVETIRAINPTWNYGENSHDVYWQLHHFFDAHVAKVYIEKAMKEYASQAIDEAAERAECKNEGTYGGDGESMDYYVVDKQSILKVKAELK